MMKLMLYIIMLNLNIMLFSYNMLIYMLSMLLIMITFIYMFMINYNFNWMMVYSWLGIDSISFILIVLSLWIISMMFMVSMKIKNNKLYSFILLMLLISLLMSFSSMNYFMFYLFFEISLIPTFMLIIGWGYQPERLNASMFMLLYTLFASLPLLMIMYYLFNWFNSLSFLILLNSYFLNLDYTLIMYLYMILAFLIKLPLIMFHMWLPKAHVEAPVSGSMILAGVMLKLGGYGMIRSILMMMNLSMKYNYLVISMSLLSTIMLSLVCLRQIDLKLLVAYSSIVHMAMMLMGILTLTKFGILGGLIMMVGHGLCSSALFMLVNLFYERSKSRNIYLNKGLLSMMPTLMMWWFMFCICNMSSPISLNLLSELMILMVMLKWSMNMIMLLMSGMFLSAMYSLYLFSIIQHGKYSHTLNKIYSINNLNYLTLYLHWIPLNFLILKMSIFM